MVAEGSSPVRVLLDTNVILGLLLLRQPWLGQAQPMWDARDAGTIIACLPTSALTNIYYIGRRQIGQLQIMDGMRFCIANFELASLERQDAEFATTLPGADFEDNLQIACAVRARVQFIVTRDPSGFAGVPVPLRAVDPPTLMTSFSPPVP
jgi:predicted nucleic acid-binding protein